MNDQRRHPRWCSRRYCTAYPARPMDREYHRSEPLVVLSEDPDVAFYVHRGADPDGSGEYIEIAELEVPFDGAFYDVRRRNGWELLMQLPVADSVCKAIEVSLAGKR